MKVLSAKYQPFWFRPGLNVLQRQSACVVGNRKSWARYKEGNVYGVKAVVFRANIQRQMTHISWA